MGVESGVPLGVMLVEADADTLVVNDQDTEMDTVPVIEPEEEPETDWEEEEVIDAVWAFNTNPRITRVASSKFMSSICCRSRPYCVTGDEWLGAVSMSVFRFRFASLSLTAGGSLCETLC